MTSGGNERYPKDTVVTFVVISGHRDALADRVPGSGVLRPAR